MREETAESTPQEIALDLVARHLSRTKNYPREAAGVEGLADALLKASVRTQVPMRTIVERCAETSSWCPTDRDLLTVACDIRDQDRARTEGSKSQYAQWEREYGKPQPFPMQLPAKRVRRNDALWAALRKQFPAGWPDWRTLAAAARKLGYEDYARAWENWQAGK